MSFYKRRRLINFDYSTKGAYFITICTKNHEYLLWEDGAYSEDNGYKLSEYGKNESQEKIVLKKVIALSFQLFYILYHFQYNKFSLVWF